MALTSKPELPIRDRLTFYLHETLKDKKLSVSREYPLGRKKRADIAILDDETPTAFAEVKAYSFFNLDQGVHPRRKPKAIEDEIGADYEKCEKYRNEKCKGKALDVYCLFLAPNIETERIPDSFPHKEIITSWGGWSSYKKNGKRQGKDIVTKEMCEFFKGKKWNIISQGEMKGGSAFELEMSVLYWLPKYTIS